MKKVISSAAGAITVVLLFSGTAMAASISNTGPGSYNSIKVNDKCKVSVSNNTNVNVTNNNSQSSSSGNATVGGNTSGGSATSGNATNSSSSSFNFNVTNGNIAACAPQQVTPPPSNPPTQQNNGGHVSGVSTTSSQVQAPVGGVGAGVGGLSSIILAISLLSGTVGMYRLQKHLGHEA